MIAPPRAAFRLGDVLGGEVCSYFKGSPWKVMRPELNKTNSFGVRSMELQPGRPQLAVIFDPLRSPRAAWSRKPP